MCGFVNILPDDPRPTAQENNVPLCVKNGGIVPERFTVV